ncbi:General transcription factor II-I repeat domain-containing protein 2-like [Oopsacas minuta]|uniref:General transcription factor II-I repeat domain-containing protein 2-like n=1 Tax=Oopsacas minuta TaxID=111878 RepID=A0AAV7JU14_9METZ|nr:General transcription factor II-I repeat domain-containing protein 2-like [Oopsacas minuta]
MYTAVRSAKLASLKLAKLTAQKLMMKTINGASILRATITSVKISLVKIAQMEAQAKKAYSDVDLIMKCARVIVEEITDDKETKLISQTRGQDIFNCVMETLHNFNMPVQKICTLTTDGAPLMTGKTRLSTLFKEHGEIRNNVLTYHCIIHQENLASLHTEMFEEVMKDIVNNINFNRSHPLNHRQFRELLNDYDVHYIELVYHSRVG